MLYQNPCRDVLTDVCPDDQFFSASRAQFRSGLFLFDSWGLLDIADQFAKLVSVNKINRFALGEASIDSQGPVLVG
jgi:hypothetical protein